MHEPVVRGLWFGLAAALIWGGFPVLTRFGLTHTLGAQDITALRFAVAGLITLPVLWHYRRTSIPVIPAWIMVCGAGMPYILVVSSGLLYTPASHFGVITPSSNLLFAAVGAVILLNETIRPLRYAGMAVIVIGLVLIAWEGLFSVPGAWLGDGLFLTGGFFWAGYTLASRRAAIQPLHAIAWVSVISASLYLPWYVLFASKNIWHAPSREILIQCLYQGVASAVLALWLYTHAVKILNASRAAVFGALVPATALMLAIPVLHEWPTVYQIAGVLVVSIGMLLALWPTPVVQAVNPRPTGGGVD